ncbi:MAG TPA: HD domain-containing protein [Clostridiales bacterium]|nr:HD domain-containing protein [Clostridiales bacterium]
MNESTNYLLQYHDLILSIVAAMEARDFYTACHSMRVAEMTEALCGYLGLNEDERTLYHIAAHLHDLGKIGIEDSVLRKTSNLSEKEWVLMKEHPKIGYNILHKIDSFEEISKIVRAHHERWDGKGYPDKLIGNEIPFGSRIITVADSIDAMLSTRPYRKEMSPTVCKSEINRNIGTMYAPDIARTAIENWDDLLLRRNAVCVIEIENHYAGTSI